MAVSVSKTRDVLVDVARQLFARMGFHNTTMNDIAQASQKGRRTLYTYFKNKDDVFDAVVEAELDKLVDSLTEIAARQLLSRHLAGGKSTQKVRPPRDGNPPQHP